SSDLVVHGRAHQVLQAERVNQQAHAIGIHRHVVFALFLVELEAVLETGTPAALDVHAQLERRVALALDQLLDLGRRGGGEIDRTLQGLVASVAFGKTNDIHAAQDGARARAVQAPGLERPVASAHGNDCSTALPRAGAARTVTRTGVNPAGSMMSPCTCWKYLNE